MTVTALIKKLQAIQKKHPRAIVVGDADTFSDGDYTLGQVNDIYTDTIEWSHDGTKKFVVVLTGH